MHSNQLSVGFLRQFFQRMQYRCSAFEAGQNLDGMLAERQSNPRFSPLNARLGVLQPHPNLICTFKSVIIYLRNSCILPFRRTSGDRLPGLAATYKIHHRSEWIQSRLEICGNGNAAGVSVSAAEGMREGSAQINIYGIVLIRDIKIQLNGIEAFITIHVIRYAKV